MLFLRTYWDYNKKDYAMAVSDDSMIVCMESVRT